MTPIIHVPAQQPASLPCRIAFVGEAPGEEELAHGKPLVGPSGNVFNAALRAADLDRKEYWVGNVFDEKIPDNDISEWCAQTREAREGGFDDLPPIGSAGYLRPEFRWHLSRLESELQSINPTVIVPLGGTALWAFTGRADISAIRGNVTGASRIRPGAKLLPALHPAHVIHQWKYLPILVGDFIKASREADRGPQIEWPRRTLTLEPSLDTLASFSDRCRNSDLLSVDIETGFGQMTCIGLSPSVEESLVVPFCDFRRPSRSYWSTAEQEVQALQWVKEILEHPVPKLGQNYGGYDAYWLLAKYGIRTMNMREDTRLLHHALYPELPKDLAFLSGSYTQQGAWKTFNTHRKQEKRDS